VHVAAEGEGVVGMDGSSRSADIDGAAADDDIICIDNVNRGRIGGVAGKVSTVSAHAAAQDMMRASRVRAARLKVLLCLNFVIIGRRSR